MLSDYERNNRIGEALILRNMKQVDLAEKTGLNKSAINSWLKQKWQPKQSALFLMGRALNVSEMWLAGYDVPMERTPRQIKNDENDVLFKKIQSDDRLRDFCITASKLNEEQFSTVESIINQFSKINGGE